MHVDRNREVKQRECVCDSLFPSIKQSLFSSPDFKRNLVPGREPTLTLKLSLCRSMAPIVVSRELFHNCQLQRIPHRITSVSFCFSPALVPFSPSVFLSLICFQTQGCEKAAKDIASKHWVMWLQAVLVFPLYLPIVSNIFFSV